MHPPESGLDEGETPALVAQDVGFANILSKTHLSNNNAFTFAWAAPEVRHPVCRTYADIAGVAASPCRQSIGCSFWHCMTDAFMQCTVWTPACCVGIAWKVVLSLFSCLGLRAAPEGPLSAQAAACHSCLSRKREHPASVPLGRGQ